MSRAPRPFALAALLALAHGCGAGRQTAPAPRDALAARFASPEALRARASAPDLHARAERARARARAAVDARARSDHEAEAALWLEAAIAEALRIERVRATAAARARSERARAARAELERERIAVERRLRRERSARAARAAAAHAFLEAPPGHAAAASRAGAAEQRARDAEVLRDRARLALAAARAIGLPEASAAEPAAALARAEHARPAAALESARAALELAERALGEARARAPHGPSPEESAALLEMARERGFEAEASAQGVLLAVPAEKSAARMRRQGARLAALVRAHPRGAIRIEAHAAGDAGPASRRAARARAEQLADPLRRAASDDRIEVADVAEGDPERIQVVFTAYRSAGTAPP